MFEVRVESKFSAAHRLRNYRGKCENLHGHNWKVEVSISADRLSKNGMVVDFKEVQKKLNSVLNKLDHRYLNSTQYFKRINPTSENMAKFIYDKLAARGLCVRKVRVWESENASASYRAD